MTLQLTLKSVKDWTENVLKMAIKEDGFFPNDYSHPALLISETEFIKQINLVEGFQIAINNSFNNYENPSKTYIVPLVVPRPNSYRAQSVCGHLALLFATRYNLDSSSHLDARHIRQLLVHTKKLVSSDESLFTELAKTIKLYSEIYPTFLNE